MKIAFAILGVSTLLFSHAAFAGNAFDGNWDGEMSGRSARIGVDVCAGSFKATATNNNLVGRGQIGSIGFPFAGTIADDGSFSTKTGLIKGQFKDKSFSGTYTSPSGSSCTGSVVTLDRSK